MPADLQSFELECHPAATRPAVKRLQVQLGRGSGGMLRLRYLLEAHVARLLIPASAASERTDELWRHTCFEAFISIGDEPWYYELNLSPSSQWALYRFDSYRQGIAPVPVSSPPEIAVRRSEYRLEVDATVQIAELPELIGDAPLRLALAAVLEADDGSLSYWALQHPPGKPDFHRAEGFTARLAAAI